MKKIAWIGMSSLVLGGLSEISSAVSRKTHYSMARIQQHKEVFGPERNGIINISRVSKICIKTESEESLRHLSAITGEGLGESASYSTADVILSQMKHLKYFSESTPLNKRPVVVVNGRSSYGKCGPQFEIVILQTLSKNRHGTPYRASVEVRAKGVVWKMAVERPNFVEMAPGTPIIPGNKTPEGKPYWTPHSDIQEIVESLIHEIRWSKS